MHQLGEYEPRDRPRIIEEHRLDLGPGILHVLPESPASRAGLRAGDILLSVNGKPFQQPERAARERDSTGQRTALEEADTQVENELARGPARIELLRAGQALSASLSPVWGCSGRVRLARSAQPNAFADGTYAIMTTRLLSFIRSDDELALVLAHEMAHNLLGHPARLKALGISSGAARSFGRNAGRVWATEEEADKLAVKLLASAGYDLGAVMPFWRRFYANYESRLQLFRTHPSLAARERIFREALAELPRPAGSR